MELETHLQALVRAIAEQYQVRAIGLSGGDRPLPRPGAGDLDLFVYCSTVPLEASRSQALQSLGKRAESIQVGRFKEGHWGVGDSLLLAGVETWIMHFSIGEARCELYALLGGQNLDRADGEYYPIGRLAMLQTIRSLYDPDGILAGFRARLAQYPDSLASAALAYHLEKLADTEDLDRAVLRGDVLFYHYALDVALDHLLQALFALNRTYFPSRKRTLEFVERFDRKPASCSERLLEVVRWGGQADTIAQSRAAWSGLVADLKSVCPPKAR